MVVIQYFRLLRWRRCWCVTFATFYAAFHHGGITVESGSVSSCTSIVRLNLVLVHYFLLFCARLMLLLFTSRQALLRLVLDVLLLLLLGQVLLASIDDSSSS
mmetsp:Transcript_10364/g.17603  ORF Transcript_10364/g.17603 Transcript_10364/m.17603 type:complete len:102 (-) Transcript_10364:19-324(-)